MDDSSRTENAGRNVISAFVNKMCILLLTFISRKIFIQYIGVEYLGINALFSNVLTLLSMADLGVGTAMNVSLYEPIAKNDTERLAALLGCFRKIYCAIAAVVTVIGIALVPVLKYIINVDVDLPYLNVYYVIFVLKNAFSYLFVYKSAIICADQKTYVVNRIEVWVNILKIVLQISAVAVFQKYIHYLLIEAVSVVINNIILSVIADKRYPFIRRDVKLNRNEKKKIYNDIYSVFLYKVSGSMLNGTDNILMSILVGTIYVGMYSNYYTITNNVEMFIGLLFTSLTASIGNLVVTAGTEKRYQVFKTMQMVSFWLCGFVVVCLLYLTQDFIQIWLGKDMLLDQLTLVAIVTNVFFSSCMRPVWTFREGTGMYREIRYVMLGASVLNLILSVILGRWMGISGIIFASSISRIATYFWYEPRILFRKFFKKKETEYYGDYMKNFVLVFTSIAVCYIPIQFFSSVNIFSWLAKGIICGMSVSIIYFLYYRKSEEFLLLKEKVKQLINR